MPAPRNPAVSTTTPRRRAALRAGALLIAAAVLAAVLLVALTGGKELDARHEPAAFRETFDFGSSSFSDYIAFSERRIRAARAAASDELVAQLVAFRLEPAATCANPGNAAYYNGIVLTHDLLETPYSMRFMAEYFQQRCFVVYGLLLPGHASQPGDLLDARWEEWAAAERFAARALAAEVENVYLGGHGIGATLSILEASGNAGVDGLVLFGPTLASPRFAWQAPLASLLGWLLPAAQWNEVVPGWSSFIYDSTPWRLRGEVDGLVAATLDALPERPFEVPVFGVVSTDDATGNAPAALAYMAERVHALTQTLVFSRDPESAAQPGQQVFPSQFARGRVLGLSHRALPKNYNDPEFGLDGLARDCGHYYRADRPAYERCMAGEAEYAGEVLPELLAQGLLARVGSNIGIDRVTAALDAFVAPVGTIPPYVER